KSYGVPRNRVKVVYSGRNLLKALEEGKVDAIATWEPYLFQARSLFPTESTVTFHQEFYMEKSLLVGLAPVVETKGESVKRVLRALVRAEDFVLQNPDDAFSMVQQQFPEQTEAALRAVWDATTPEVKLDNLLVMS